MVALFAVVVSVVIGGGGDQKKPTAKLCRAPSASGEHPGSANPSRDSQVKHMKPRNMKALHSRPSQCRTCCSSGACCAKTQRKCLLT